MRGRSGPCGRSHADPDPDDIKRAVKNRSNGSRLHGSHLYMGTKKAALRLLGTSNRIRTGVSALRGRCPRPLDNGGMVAGELGFEPRQYESES